MIPLSPFCLTNPIGISAQSIDNSGMNLSADTLDIFLQKMPMGIAIFNRDYTLHQSNAIWAGYIEKVTGISSQNIQPGLHLNEIFPTKIADLQPYFDTAFNGQTVSQELFPLTTKRATCYWNVFFSPLRENEEEPKALMIAMDVTQRKQAEAAAQTAEQALLTLMNSLPGMAYRGPLTDSREMELVNAHFCRICLVGNCANCIFTRSRIYR